MREMMSVNPLDTIVSKTMKIESATWYIPSASAPIVRDKKMRKKNPNIRVKSEKAVIIATFLKIDFI